MSMCTAYNVKLVSYPWNPCNSLASGVALTLITQILSRTDPREIYLSATPPENHDFVRIYAKVPRETGGELGEVFCEESW